MARRYAFLDFQAGVDWKDVNQTLLAKLNRLAMATHTRITVTSGYRSLAEQQYLWDHAAQLGLIRGTTVAKPGSSNHEHGLAVDAVVNGQGVGKFYARATLAKYGLTTLYDSSGKAFDDNHIELLSGGKPTKATAAASPASDQSVPSVTQLGSAAHPDVTIPSYQPPDGPPSPFDTVAQPAAPGSGGAGINPEPDPAQAWQEIAAQPVADPTTAAFAQQVAVALGR